MINDNIIISNELSLLDVLGVMDKTNRKLLIVCDGKRFIGVISIGDIQRALLKKKNLSLSVSEFTRTVITYASVTDDLDIVKARMLSEKIEAMPIIDEDGNLCDVIEWAELFNSEESRVTKPVDLPVVIMAGGKGTRLLPLTNVIPKPLIPVSDKTIIEEIMWGFKKAGSDKFFISVNYKNELIQSFFEKNNIWNIEFIKETKPLGTGGSLYLIKNRFDSPFFVINCDTLLDINLYDLYEYHQQNGNLITIVTAVKSLHIPYGTVDTDLDGIVSIIKEKPDYVYQVNTGFYLMQPEVLNYIEDDQFLNIPDLVMSVINDGKKVGAFPISEKSWKDIGNWDEYLSLVNKYNPRP